MPLKRNILETNKKPDLNSQTRFDVDMHSNKNQFLSIVVSFAKL